ncbi:MAG: TIGR03943 family protein [Ardenticatenales bacterium]|nr:TIGR03943 family protein [Ardenticatenales bacterium]
MAYSPTPIHDVPDHRAPSRWLPLWQAALIGLTGLMLLIKIYTGTLPLYVHTRYTPLILGTGVTLLLLALLQSWFTLRSPEGVHIHGHEHGATSWRSVAMLALLVPIVLGLFVPSRALGSAAIDTRGFGTSGTGIRTVQSVAGESALIGIPDPTQWTMLDWVNALLYQPDNPRLQGQPIEQTGFVWRRGEMEQSQFILSRFVLSCCTADSLAIGLPVVWPEASALQSDGWVRVRGTVGLANVMGHQEAVILAEEVVPIEQPAEPYLYP